MTANAADATPRTSDGRPWVVYDPEEAKQNISPEALAAARAELDAEIAAYNLAEIRRSQRRTQTDVAREMGVSQKRVSTIESAELAHTEVDTISRYVEALGGRVRLVADFPGHTITIR